MTMFGSNKGDGGEIVFLGLGCDFGSSGPKGCAIAPEVLRTLNKLNGSDGNIIDISSGRDLFHLDTISDFGILKYREDQKIESYLKGIELISENIIKDKKLFSLGGDHLITYPLLKGALKAHKKIQCLHFDAHFDCNPIDHDSRPSHNNFVSYLLEEEGICKWVAVGQRGIGKKKNNPSNKFVNKSLSNFKKELDKEIPLYITIDCDVLDLNEFKAVSYPQPGAGPKMVDLLDALRILIKDGHKIIGIDICEYNPKMDSENYLYGRILSHFIAEILSIIKPGNLN